jgi:hypothetical protein
MDRGNLLKEYFLRDKKEYISTIPSRESLKKYIDDVDVFINALNKN